MAKVTVKANGRDLTRVKNKARKAYNFMKSPEGPVFHYAGEVATDYCDAIVSGMGRFHGGASAHKQLSSDMFQFWIHWAPLSSWAMREKEVTGEFYFWRNTGRTQNAVKVHYQGDSVFAGIDKDDDWEAYYRALRTEFGADGEWTERHLFTVANIAFMQNREVILKALHDKAIDSFLRAGWGKS